MHAQGRGRVWAIHGGALVVWAVILVVVCWDAWFPPVDRRFNLDGIGAAIMSVMFVVYAAVTTIIMLAAGRRVAVPLVMHGCMFGVYAVFVWIEAGERREREADATRSRVLAEKERQPDGCLYVRRIRVEATAPMRAVLTLVNECDAGVVVDDVVLSGFAPAGGNVILGTKPGTVLPTLMRGETAQVTVESLGKDVPAGDVADWAWKGSVDVESPRSTMLCFATPGAPEAGWCAAIGSVEVVRTP